MSPRPDLLIDYESLVEFYLEFSNFYRVFLLSLNNFSQRRVNSNGLIAMLCFKNMKSYFKQDSSALPYTENQVCTSKWTNTRDLKIWLDLKMFLILRMIGHTLSNQSLEDYLFLKHFRTSM